MLKKSRRIENTSTTPQKLINRTFQISAEKMGDAYRVTDNAIDELHRRGIMLTERPSLSDSKFTDENGFPVTPLNLMELNNDELGELFSIVDSWKIYISGQVAEAEVRHEEISKHAELVAAKIRLQKSDLKQADKTAAVTADTRYIKSQQELMESKAFLTLLRNAEGNMETKRKTISRIISLRDQEIRSGSRLCGLGAKRIFAEHIADINSSTPHLNQALSTKSKRKLIRKGNK
jgi:hypothetical protein